MPSVRPRSLLFLVVCLAACHRGPSREEALAAIRTAQPALDTAVVYGRVWQDGPPWFSCAEVTAKLGTSRDSLAVRDEVGNWKTLLAAGWIALRDSSKGVVADPGWCTARLTAAGEANAARWTPVQGPEFPTGSPRRGWWMLVGRRRIEVAGAPRTTDTDAATAEFLVRVATNADGVATGADRDTARYVAELRKVDGTWRMTGSRPLAGR